MTAVIATIVAGYLLGSIPFGLLAGWMKGIDVRRHGSGNIGATNVFRVLGRGWGIAVFFCDAAKGFFPVLLGRGLTASASAWIASGELYSSGPALPPLGGAILGGLCAILGHTFPIWLGFKGGKGVATSLGVVIGLAPLAAGIALVVWIAVFGVTRYVSLASMTAAVSVPIVVALQPSSPDKWPLFVLCAAVASLILYRHRPNIQRLLQGTEHRFGKQKQP